MPVRNLRKFKIALGRVGAVKRHREDDEEFIELDENLNSKKSRNETKKEVNNSILLFEEKFKETVRSGIDLFHNRILSTDISLKQKLAYMQILKKISMSLEWKLKRVVSNKSQLECLTKKTIESPTEKKKLLQIMEKFVDYKLDSFPGINKICKSESLAKHYRNELKSYGVTQAALTTKIDDLLKAIEIAEGIKPKSETKQKKAVQIINKKLRQNMCRLCGSKDRLIYNINHKRDNVRFRDIVEQFIRVKINNENNLPQLVCKNCKDYIDGITKFAEKVSNFQQQLNSEIMDSLIDPENIKKEIIDLDYSEPTELSTSAAAQNEMILDDSMNESIIHENLYTERDDEESNCDNESMTIEQCEILDNSDELLEGQNDQSQTELLTEISTNNNNIIDKVISSETIQSNDESSSDSIGDNSSTQIPTSSCTPLSNSFNLTRPCYLILQRLQIEYLPSDDDDDDDENPENLLIELCENDKNVSKKRRGRRPKIVEADFENFFSSIPNMNIPAT